MNKTGFKLVNIMTCRPTRYILYPITAFLFICACATAIAYVIHLLPSLAIDKFIMAVISLVFLSISIIGLIGIIVLCFMNYTMIDRDRIDKTVIPTVEMV